MLKSFKIYTLGCKVNQYDSRYLKRILLNKGFREVEKDNDLVVVNTCSVTRNAVKKDRRIINRARRENPGAILVVLGCWPKAYPKEVEALGPDLVWGTGEIKDLSEEILKKMNINDDRGVDKEVTLISENRTRYFVKIQDGCQQFCSYCIIPYTRGPVKSRSFKDIKIEVQKAISKGFQEIVLTGIHLGLYGSEKGRSDLCGLLKELLLIKGLGRIRLSSIEVNEVSQDLIRLIKENEKLCPHLHIPLQSGSKKILKDMNRPYTPYLFKKKINNIRHQIPDMAISTDVMVGFPGEGEKEFLETLDLVKRIEFSDLHVFPFSPHQKTPASKFQGKVSEQEVKERSLSLKKLAKRSKKDFRESFGGQVVHPVVEKIDGRMAKGRTEYYFEVSFGPEQIKKKGLEWNEDIIGRIVPVIMNDF